MVLDHLDHIEVRPEDLVNRHALSYLPLGISQLAYAVRNRELEILRSDVAPDFHMAFHNNAYGLESCMFHWFSVSSINFLRLVATIDFMKTNGVTTADMTTTSLRNKLNDYCTEYADRVAPEMSVWRNKVAAHFSLTAPRKDDDIASLDHSVIVPVAYLKPHLVASAVQPGWSTNPLPSWSLTQQYEKLRQRFWPFSPKLPDLGS